MSLETLHVILNVIMVFVALYLICIGAFTYGLSVLSRGDNKDATLWKIKKISVLIAARNEAKNIERLLQSLYNQSYKKEDFEVVLVDDHSHPDLKIRLLKAEGNGKKQAISQALHAAENEIIMVTDADCELPVKWIEKMLAYYEKKDLKMLLGPVLLSPANSLFESFKCLSI